LISSDLSEILISESLLDAESAAKLSAASAETGEGLTALLGSTSGVPFERLSEVLQKHFGIGTFKRGEFEFDNRAVALVSPDVAERHSVMPVCFKDGALIVAFADPFDTRAHEDLQALCDHSVAPLFANLSDIKYFIDHYYGASKRSGLGADIEGRSVVKLLDEIIKTAVLRGASDVHIEPFEKLVRLRLRIDGSLREVETLPSEILPNLISRLKVCSGMDISERRLPQDGHFKRQVGDKKIDFRVSTVLTIYGEKAVVRLIYEEGGMFDTNGLGFFEDDLLMLGGLFRSRHGVILLTGPTGSGKTTTLAALIRELNKADVNITTVEDPVENVIHGVNQININPKTGFFFANALRSILRQDPDVIMVGEIRDEETASLAVRSAITGHLVLSTLHTNDAVGAIFRLIDMNVPDYLVYSAIRGVVSQRLVRRICPRCKIKTAVTKDEALLLRVPEGTEVYSGGGCEYCDGSGYAGRFAVYEILACDEELRRFLWRKPSAEEVEARLKNGAMKTLWDCALRNVLIGNTTVSEMLKSVLY